MYRLLLNQAMWIDFKVYKAFGMDGRVLDMIFFFTPISSWRRRV